nr:hypothetical protein [Tanacetum cinerariifolium]
VPQREKSSEQRYFSERSRLSHTNVNNGKSKESFNKQTTLLEKQMDESIPLDKQCQSSLEIFKVKSNVNTIITGVEVCKQKISNRTYIGYIDPFIQSTIESNFCPVLSRISAREYYYANHMNAILEVYTELDEVTNLQCDYLELLEKCKGLETELLKSKMMSKSFESVQKHAINLELELQQCKEKIKNDMLFKVNKSKDFCKERKQYFEIQDLKAQLQDKGIVISELKKLIEKLKGKSVDTKFEKSSVIRQPNAFKSQRPSVLGKPTTFSNSFIVSVLLVSWGKPSESLFTLNLPSINGKRYVLVIVDDYSRYTWTHFLRSKDETPEVFIDFLRLVQRGLQAQVRVVRTDKGTEFLNQTLHAYFAAEGILHQMSVARTPEQNGVVERRNRTLVEAARTMLSVSKVPLFFWAEAIATACFTQNRSLVIPRHEKTPYHIINDQKSSVKFFHIFSSLCYIVRDGGNLDKMKEKGNECIFVRYSTYSRAYRVFNKRTRVIMESIHVNFDELPQMASDHISSDPAPECQSIALNHDSLSPVIQRQANVPQAYRTVTTSNELDLLFSLMFDELLNGSSKVVSKSSVVSDADAPYQCQHHTTPLNIHTTPAPTFADDEFINIFSTPVQDQGETSSHHVDSSNMHTFYQRYPSEHRWTKDHPLEQVIGNPSQSVKLDAN